MATTPIWVTLVVALLGFGSVLFTQLIANHREDVRWHREREREKATWAREDAVRSYQHRREAYVDFVRTFREQWNSILSIITEEEDDARPPGKRPYDYLDPSYNQLAGIEIFGTKEAAKLANKALGTLYGGVFGDRQIPPDVLEPLLNEIRRDLGSLDLH